MEWKVELKVVLEDGQNVQLELKSLSVQLLFDLCGILLNLGHARRVGRILVQVLYVSVYFRLGILDFGGDEVCHCCSHVLLECRKGDFSRE